MGDGGSFWFDAFPEGKEGRAIAMDFQINEFMALQNDDHLFQRFAPQSANMPELLVLVSGKKVFVVRCSL